MEGINDNVSARVDVSLVGIGMMPSKAISGTCAWGVPDQEPGPLECRGFKAFRVFGLVPLNALHAPIRLPTNHAAQVAR